MFVSYLVFNPFFYSLLLLRGKGLQVYNTLWVGKESATDLTSVAFRTLFPRHFAFSLFCDFEGFYQSIPSFHFFFWKNVENKRQMGKRVLPLRFCLTFVRFYFDFSWNSMWFSPCFVEVRFFFLWRTELVLSIFLLIHVPTRTMHVVDSSLFLYNVVVHCSVEYWFCGDFWIL